MTPSTKKLIILIGAAVLLVAVLLIVLFACGGSQDDPDDSDSQSNSTSDKLPQPSESNSDKSTDSAEPKDSDTSDDKTTTDTNKPEDPTDSAVTNKPEDPSEPTSDKEEPTEPPTDPIEPEDNFKTVDDTVYITEDVYSYKSAFMDVKYILLEKGSSYRRTGKNGKYSCIMVGSVPCYVSNDYISTNSTLEPDGTGSSTKPEDPAEPSEFVECDEIYYVSAYRLWLRTSPDTSTDSNKVYSAEIKQGQSFRAIAKNDRFIKILYEIDGKEEICYLCMIGSDGKVLLTTDKNSIDLLPEGGSETDTTIPSTPTEPSETEPDDQPSK